MSGQWKLHKFGGSSLADAECFARVATLLLDNEHARIGVVVSAMGGMTDALLRLVTLAEQGDAGFLDELDSIGERYASTARALIDGDSLVQSLDGWGKDAEALKETLARIASNRAANQLSRDVVAGYGEIWSARLLAALLQHRNAERGGSWIDARDVLIVSHTELGPTVNWDRSRTNFGKQVAADFTGVAVITGFIATDEAGLQTTLGPVSYTHLRAHET